MKKMKKEFEKTIFDLNSKLKISNDKLSYFEF